MHASHWLNIPSKCCVVPWYTTATYVVGTTPLESRCGRYLCGRYHRYTMVFCTMCRTLVWGSLLYAEHPRVYSLCHSALRSSCSFVWPSWSEDTSPRKE